MILLTVAVQAELGFWRERDDVATLITGVGPVEAACALAGELARNRYRLVVSAGLGGAFDGAASIGDGVVVTEDTMEIDREDGSALALPNGERTVERAHSEPRLVEEMRRRGFPPLRGVTVARVTATEATARRLADRGAQIESMEGFAVLRAAERAAVPAIELRGISNRCGVREAGGWNAGAGMSGLEHAIDALLEILDSGAW